MSAEQRTYQDGIREGWRQAIAAGWRAIDGDNSLSEPKAGRPHPVAEKVMQSIEAAKPSAKGASADGK